MTLLQTHYTARADAGDAASQTIVREIERSARQSATPGVWPGAFLDVYFSSPQRGYAVGAFGLILSTEDGGKTWLPVLDRVDNERRFHLYAMGGDGAHSYIVGEQGLVLQSDDNQGRFVRWATPYNGSYFGLLVHGGQVVVHGLRGNVLRAVLGTSDWEPVPLGLESNVVACLAVGERQVLSISQLGEAVLWSPGAAPRRLALPPGGEVYGATLAGKLLVLARMSGPVTVPLDFSA